MSVITLQVATATGFIMAVTEGAKSLLGDEPSGLTFIEISDDYGVAGKVCAKWRSPTTKLIYDDVDMTMESQEQVAEK